MTRWTGFVTRLPLATVALVLTLTIPVLAQTVVVVPYDTAKLAWDYTTEEESRITGFRVDCQAGSTGFSVPAAKTDRHVLVKTVVPGPGDYTCQLLALSGQIVSAPSNSVVFGVQPVAATNFRVESQ